MSEDPHPLPARLTALAPAVDMPASRNLFERVRAQPDRSTRRWLLPAAVTALLIAGVVGVWALARDDAQPSNPAAAPDDAEAAFSVLLVAETLREGGTVDVATDADSLEKALEPAADRGGVSADFDRSIVVVFNVIGRACGPQEFDGFEVDGATWTAQFAVDEQPCEDAGVGWAYVVAVDRSALGDFVEFTLPDGALDGFAGGLDEPGPEHREVIAVEESVLPFGTIRAVTDGAAYDAMWAADLPDAEQPDVDFTRRFVVSFTLPDDSCPDTLVQFQSGEQATERGTKRRIIWEPQFEPPPGGCQQPLVTRTYVIAIDRPLVDIDVTFRLPADEVYDYDSTELAITVERMRFVIDPAGVLSGSNSPAEPDLVAAGATLLLRAV